MKAYIITLTEVPASVQAASRALISALDHGLNPEMAHGVWWDDARAAAAEESLPIDQWDESYSNTDAVIGNFVAQYRLWRRIASGNEPAVIMEHDAAVVAPIPAMPSEAWLVNLGKPSFGRVPSANRAGLHPLFSRPDKLPGAHGYYVTPAGAAQLVSMAKRKGAMPVDVFISPQRFAGILEYWPWPIEAHDSFTTIQKERGCVSKHNFGDGYKII